MKYDFSGWATRNDVRCSDGRTIRRDAFKEDDGKVVPLLYMHSHDDPDNILGHALLENRENGVYAYCKFNDTPSGQNMKKVLKNGDIGSLSIYANKLKQFGGDVVHGAIREVSLVLAGANPEAYIDYVAIAHGDESDGEAVIYMGKEITLAHDDMSDSDSNVDGESFADTESTDDSLSHSSQNDSKQGPDDENGGKVKMENDNKKQDEKTVGDVIDSMTDEQKNVLYALVGKAMEDGKNNTGEEPEVKHNVFDDYDNDYSGDGMFVDDAEIIHMSKEHGMTLQSAISLYEDENGLEHDAIAGGFVQPGPEVTGDVTMLFPEYKEVRPGAPELITNDQGWIGQVLKLVHKSPISRIRTSQVDIRNAETLRAKGYKKGKKKEQVGNFKLLRRTTDPQTVYVKNALHRDDVVDITDFDYVQYLYNIDRMNLYEELAMAIMVGDGRDEGDEYKIEEEHIRPIWTDDDLYTIHRTIDRAAATIELQGTDTDKHFGDNFVTAEAMVNAVLYAREDYKGTGTPDLFITPHMLNVMLLARDMNGHRIYGTRDELAAALNVRTIHTAEQFEGKTRKTDDPEPKTKKLVALLVNLSDYSLGATKGGEVTHFTDFDIDFNQLKSLLETRCSGALTRAYSAIAIEEDVTSEVAAG